MQPSLQPGDTIFVAKWPYGLSRHNLPLSPGFLTGRIAPSLPERGDVIIFKTPRDGKTDLVKRVIASGGDRIAVRNGRPILNGEPLPHIVSQTTASHHIVRETMPSGRSFKVQLARSTDQPPTTRDNFGPITVPARHVFLLGDNRDASTDSRYTIAEGGIGLVPLDLVVGRVDHILYGRTPARAGQRP
jgi:signal peptidase I